MLMEGGFTRSQHPHTDKPEWGPVPCFAGNMWAGMHARRHPSLERHQGRGFSSNHRLRSVTLKPRVGWLSTKFGAALASRWVVT